MKIKGFTLIELLIVIAIIAILAVVIWGAVGPRKACAQTFSSDSPMVLFLAKHEIPFLWAKQSGHLTIFGNHLGTAADTCKLLKEKDARLLSVTISNGSEAESKTELTWSEEGGTTNRTSRDEALC